MQVVAEIFNHVMKQLPIHQTISNQIRTEIQGGKYPLGSKLPTEEELCGLYNTSRPTLRQALSTLSAEGLINRRPRTGSTVIATQPPIFLSHAVGAVNELLDYPGVMTRKILDTSLILADAQLAKEIQCPIGQEWFRIVSLRFQNHASLPLCLTTYYILPKYAQVIKHPNHLSTPISEQIVDMYDVVIEKARVDIYSHQVPSKYAKDLVVKEGSSALVVTRTYTGDHDEVFQITVSSHPEDRYRYSFELKREVRLVRPPIKNNIGDVNV
jgi:DNA-binding GntR family transcriptional regulator